MGELDVSERAQELRQRLLEIGQEILQQRDVHVILGAIAQAIREHSPFQLVAISLFQRAIDPASGKQGQIAQLLTSGLSEEEEAKLQKLKDTGEFIPCQRILESAQRIGGGYYVNPETIPEIVPKGVKGKIGREGPGAWGPYDDLYFFFRHGPRIIGRLSLGDPSHGRVPTSEELEPLELFVNLATLALEKARSTQELNNFQQRLQGIYRLSEGLVRFGGGLDILLKRAVQIIRDHFAYDHVTLYLQENRKLVMKGFHSWLPREELAFETFERLNYDQGICGWVASHRQPALVPDVRHDPRYIAGHPAIRSELAVPIEEKEKLIGVLNIESIQEDTFTQEDLELLQTLARQLAIAISNVRHRQSLQEAIQEQEWVNHFLQEINRIQGFEEALMMIIQHGIDLLSPKANAGNFMLWNEAKGHFEFCATVNRDLRRLRMISFTKEQVLETLEDAERPMILTLRTQLNHPVLKRIQERTGQLPPASTISLPIREKGQLVALLNINNLDEEGVFTEEDVRRLKTLVPEIELALRRARDHERFKELALRDSLTGAFNRHYFTEFILKEQERAKRYGYPISLVMIDIDDFHEINDRFGHPEGDRVLREVAQLIIKNVRVHDTVVRYGGDEFIVIMPQTSKENAEEAMERLHKRLERWDSGLSGLRVTISFGVSSWAPKGQESLEKVLEKADAFMYHRRRTRSRARPGRKQVMIAAPQAKRSKRR